MQSVVGFTGSGQTNSGFVFVALKPLAERKLSVDQRGSRGCAASWNQVPGARLFLQAVQDIRVGGRQSNAQYQYTLQGDSLPDLNNWAPKITAELEKLSADLTVDVNRDRPAARAGDRTGQVEFARMQRSTSG